MPADIQVTAPAAPFQSGKPSIKGLPPLKTIPGRVRLVKDIMRVGRWNVALTNSGQPVMQDFTPARLQQLVNRFNEHKRAGIGHPICFDHGEHCDTSERDSVADVDELWTDGTTLWMSTYVTPAQKAVLTEKIRRVSLGAVHDWIDGTGKLWAGYSILHVALVVHPVVSPQHPFLELGLKPSGKKLAMTPRLITAADRAKARQLRGRPSRRLAMANPVGTTATHNTGDIDFPKFMKEFTRLMALFELEVPELGPENLVGFISSVADNIEEPISSRPSRSVTDAPETIEMSIRRAVNGRNRQNAARELADMNAARRFLGLPQKSS